MSAEPTFSIDLPIPLGSVLAGKYRLDKLIGAGGMGIVVLGRHLGLDQKVAIKMLRPSSMHDRDVVTRFSREARASTRIQSEHVARIIDVGATDDGTNIPFIVMEHLVGSDLSAIVKQRTKLPATEAIDYVLQACEALAEAHRMGIVHRDLKPANLFLARRADGSPLIKVLDFGISKSLGKSNEDLTTSEMMMGSPHYMSPEQLSTPKNVDSRADIWGLGGVLFRLVSGQPPFLGETAAALCAMVLTEKPRRLSSVVPDVPKVLDDAVARCMMRDPAARFATVSDLAKALSPLATEDGRSSIRRITGVESSPTLMPSMPPPPTLGEGLDTKGGTLISAPDPQSVSVHVTFGSSSTVKPVTAAAQRRPWVMMIAIGLVLITAITFGVTRVTRSNEQHAAGLVPSSSLSVTSEPPPPITIITPPESAPITPLAAAEATASSRVVVTAPTRAPRPNTPRPTTTNAAETPSAAPPPPATNVKPVGTSEYGGRK